MLAARLTRVAVSVPAIRQSEPIMTAVAGPTPEELARYPRDAPAVVMMHSFDSSCLEFRRLHPLLAQSLPTYAIDLVGWGFTDHAWLQSSSSRDLVVGPASKRQHLKAFVEQHLGGRPLVLVGASVGGAIAMDFALSYPEMVSKLVLLDPQVFIDGIGPMAQLPRFVAELGVKLLKTEWLRNQAGLAAYYDKPTYATKDAVRTGRLHTFLPGWMEANLAFMRSGGYSLSTRIKEVQVQTLVLWGRNDEILEAKFAERFPQELPASKLVYVERCGHTPHLENAGFVADQMLEFLGYGPGGEAVHVPQAGEALVEARSG